MIETVGQKQIRLDFFESESIEVSLCRQGYECICGVDEAGRGPLAGPVVAAAVLYRNSPVLHAVRDSKTLSPRNRAVLYDRVVHELEYAVGICDAGEIDIHNILRASLIAMERAVQSLTSHPSIVLVDGPYRLAIDSPSLGVVKGDARVGVISAASIVAKVTRDRLMTECDRLFPEYGFARHFGYPTREHRNALRVYGPCPIHRRSFRGVAPMDR